MAGGLAIAALTAPGPRRHERRRQHHQRHRPVSGLVGSRGDGQCIGYSNGNLTYIGTPVGRHLGPGLREWPAGHEHPVRCRPGQTITQGINP